MDGNIKFRENPLILKLDNKELRSIFTEEVCKLKEVFDKYGYVIRLAGGPVRCVSFFSIPNFHLLFSSKMKHAFILFF